MKHNYEERRQNRIDHVKEQADKNDKLSDSLYNQAKSMASVIPMGQPILVGHHSEQRDRNYRNRIHNKFGKSIQAQDTADYYRGKAVSIENNDAISSDDPAAIDKLTAKLTELQAYHAFMKEANKCIRKGDRATFLQLQYGSPSLWDQLNAEDRVHGKGFPSYQLQYCNANMTRVRNRIASLKQQEALPDLDLTVGDVRLYVNKEANRVQLLFPGKPSDEIRMRLRSSGFVWCRSEKAWQRQLSAYSIRTATELLNHL